MHLAGGVVAPKDLVLGSNRFSGKHLPGGAGVARTRRRPEDGDRRDCGANAHVGLASAGVADKAGVALRFDRGEGRADDRIAVEIKLEGSFKPPAGAGVGVNEAASGACPVPTGI